MTKPLVSVCLITYNHEKYISQAIESVLCQKVNFPYELIIADDCSPDRTRAIVAEYKNQNSDLIKLLFQERNVGGGKNFVDLLNSAQGKYLAYLEGDDYWTDEFKLQKQFDLMESDSSISLCYHKVKWMHSYDSPWRGHISNTGDSRYLPIESLIRNGWSIMSSSMFFKAINLPNGFENLYIGDYPLHVLLADRGKIAFIDETMSVYNIHMTGMSNTILNSNEFLQKYKNFNNLIYLHSYLNTHTNYKYARLFNINIYNLIVSKLSLLIRYDKRLFMNNILDDFKKFGLLYLFKGLILKIAYKIKIL